MDPIDRPLVHTPDHRNCPACEAARQQKLDPKKFGFLYFKQAAPLWLKEHAGEISTKSLKDYRFLLVPLTEFFGELPLTEIHIGHVTVYINQRLQTPRRTNRLQQEELNFGQLVGPNAVRKEISTLGQIMKRAGLWEEIARDLILPKMPKRTVGKALEPEEEQRLFTVACSNARWKLAYWGSILTAATTADHGEIRHIHLNDIDLARRTMRIREGIKNEHRDRIPALNDTAMWAVGQILKRYYRICRRQKLQPDGEHYILPGRTRGVPGFDLSKPMGSWKKAWGALCEKAELPGLRMKDLRHLAVTKLLENVELSERTILETAGHVSKEMWKVYSHIRRRPMEQAAQVLAFERPQPHIEPSPVDAVEDVDIESNLTETKARKK